MGNWPAVHAPSRSWAMRRPWKTRFRELCSVDSGELVLSRRVVKAIADAAHGDDVLWEAGVVFQLLAQPANMHVEGAGVAQVVGLPYLVHDHAAIQHLAGVLHQEMK